MRQTNKCKSALFNSMALSLILLLAGISGMAQTQKVAGVKTSKENSRLVREIRHELLTLPWYGVFDWLEGNVSPDGDVVLRGWVVRPTTKSEAEARVKDIEGVTHVSNNIVVLPLSPNDDRLRRAAYVALFNGNSQLFRYAMGANPSIHIIVNNGRLTLKGVVSSEGDRNFANIKARGVPGIFEVTNDLVVEKG